MMILHWDYKLSIEWA